MDVLFKIIIIVNINHRFKGINDGEQSSLTFRRMRSVRVISKIPHICIFITGKIIYRLAINGKTIPFTSSTKYLYLYIVNKYCKQVIVRLRKLVVQDVLMKARASKVCWQTYGNVFWRNRSSTERLFILQKRLITSLCNGHFLCHCKTLFQILNILTLTPLYIYWRWR